MKKQKTFLFITILIINLILLSGILISKKQDYSAVENRYLQTFSIYKFNDYLSDHFPFRNEFISLKNKVNKLAGNTLINGVYVTDDYLIPEFKDNDKKDAMINIINNFAQKNSGVDVMIVPDSIAINSDKLKRSLSTDEQSEIDYLYSKLNTNNINVFNELLQENNLYDNQYYHSDHHWTSFGAYTAYKKYFENKNITPLEKDDFTIKEVSNDFNGTSSSIAIGFDYKDSIYTFNTNANLSVEYVNESIKTDTLYNEKYLNEKDKYAMFLDNNHALIHITNNDINDSSSLLIIKNSYANCFVPLIVNHYQNVYVIDLRYFKTSVSDFIKENSIQNTLILYNLNNFYSDMSIATLK